MRRSALVVALAALLVGRVEAQDSLRLTAREAVDRAVRSHPDLIDARQARAAALARAEGSRATYLPRVALEWSAIRSDDPVAVFGSKLRQGIFAAPDLALDALNSPSPITNTSIGVTVEQPLVVAEGWLGRRAATRGAEAGRLFEGRAEQLTAFDAIRAYFGAVVAKASVEAVDSGLVAGNRVLDRVRALRREGVVTAVDEQLALARVSELESQRAMAEAERIAAVDRMLVLLGEDPGSPVRFVDPLDAAAAAAGPGEGTRLDLAGLEAAAAATEANVDRVRAQWLPSLAAFGSLGWNQGRLGAFGGPSTWTAGLVVRWNVFGGYADVAALRAARAERTAALERLDAAERQAAAEVRAADAAAAAEPPWRCGTGVGGRDRRPGLPRFATPAGWGPSPGAARGARGRDLAPPRPASSPVSDAPGSCGAHARRGGMPE
ncbi:MAG: TolC family protein [Gemmatimonadales bacterium]